MKEGKFFKWFLVCTFLTIAILFGYESYAQHYMPDKSIITELHRYGYAVDLQVHYKPSRSIWHKIGWIGSFMMCLLMLYSVRKRVHRFHNLGPLKYWLRIHIFLGLTGPLLVFYHTTFKFKGIVATSFWSMVITVCFGILGRYIYSKIPHSISGADLKVNDIDKMVEGLDKELGKYMEKQRVERMISILTSAGEDEELPPLKALLFYVKYDLTSFLRMRKLKRSLKKEYKITGTLRKKIIALFKKKSTLNRRRKLLKTSQMLLNYWHVVHIPLAILMFTIMFIHIAAYYLFRPVV